MAEISVKKRVESFVLWRTRVSHTVSRPLFITETLVHGGYCYAAWSEGQGLYSLMAGALLVVVVTSAVFGEAP